MTVAPVGQRPSATDFLGTNLNAVTPGYFTTMGMRLVAGRELTDADVSAKPRRVVVNQAFVRRHYPERDPIGEAFGPGPPEQEVGAVFEIAGVVSDAKYRSMREPMMPTVYSWAQDFDAFVLHVRSRASPRSIIEPVRQTLSALDPTLPLIEVATIADEVSASTAGERLTAALASVFAATAAAITAVGLYGLLAYIVLQRRREIGIRMALGARIADIGLMVGRQSGAMVAGGTVLGLGGALAAAQTIRSLLYGVEPWDFAVFAAAAAFVVVVAAAATAIPIGRAVRIEPADALRQET